SDRRLWADHRARLELGLVPLTTAPVVAQVSRSAQQVQLRRLLRGCDVVPLAATDAHDVGALAGASGVADVVDVHVVLVASRARASVLTSDAHDLRRVAGTLPQPVALLRV
ncbi:MAG: PIN domain nuclease, partial [Actinobacteria bacterium]|nr:PIN domain nuclease [Actinomycetota bacterium]